MVGEAYTCPDHPDTRRGDADWMALMHPPLGVVLADFLCEVLNHAETYPWLPGPQEPVMTIVREILRGE